MFASGWNGQRCDGQKEGITWSFSSLMAEKGNRVEECNGVLYTSGWNGQIGDGQKE